MRAKEMNISKFTRREDYNNVLFLSDTSYKDMQRYISNSFSKTYEDRELSLKNKRFKKGLVVT
jgi:hypothetical protein